MHEHAMICASLYYLNIWCAIPQLFKCQCSYVRAFTHCYGDHQVRTGGKVQNDDILSFAKLFNDELTLDNISRCMTVPPFAVGQSMLRESSQDTFCCGICIQSLVEVLVYCQMGQKSQQGCVICPQRSHSQTWNFCDRIRQSVLIRCMSSLCVATDLSS